MSSLHLHTFEKKRGHLPGRVGIRGHNHTIPFVKVFSIQLSSYLLNLIQGLAGRATSLARNERCVLLGKPCSAGPDPRRKRQQRGEMRSECSFGTTQWLFSAVRTGTVNRHSQEKRPSNFGCGQSNAQAVIDVRAVTFRSLNKRCARKCLAPVFSHVQSPKDLNCLP